MTQSGQSPHLVGARFFGASADSSRGCTAVTHLPRPAHPRSPHSSFLHHPGFANGPLWVANWSIQRPPWLRFQRRARTQGLQASAHSRGQQTSTCLSLPSPELTTVIGPHLCVYLPRCCVTRVDSRFEGSCAWRFAHASNPSNTGGEHAVVPCTISKSIAVGALSYVRFIWITITNLR